MAIGIRQLADELRDRIERSDHKYTPGTRLPSRDSLAVEFGCGPGTVQKALNRLQADGYVIAKRGVGTFVRPRSHWRCVHSEMDDR